MSFVVIHFDLTNVFQSGAYIGFDHGLRGIDGGRNFYWLLST